MQQELSQEIVDKIDELAEIGNDLFDDEKYQEAIAIWQKALSLIPNPQHIYGQSLWLEVSIGDAYFSLKNYAASLSFFQKAIANIEENGYHNPFILLRLGQSFLENNDTEQAKEFLLRAYMLEGENIFEGEDEKYFQFLQTNVEEIN